MQEVLTVTGHAFVGEDLEMQGVRIVVENGIIASIEEISRPEHYWILPSFFNAHTHIGDTIAMDIPAQGTLEELVAPPYGLKHRLLAATPPELLVEGMRRSARAIIRSGTAGFADFREGGGDGVRILQAALAGLSCRAIILGRDGGELNSHGIGIPQYTAGIEDAVGEMRKAGKFVAIHAGEKDPLDVDRALDLAPDLLVHATHATERQLRRCAEEEIPIAVCPRSNWALGVSRSPDHPPVRRMLDIGCTLCLGTDNVMFVQPDMFREIAFLSQVYRVEPLECLKMAISASSCFGPPFYLERGNEANFMVLDPARGNLDFSRDPAATIVRRIDQDAIARNVLSSQSK
ncbi:MAG: amidohydrolase family protein [Methanomicrobiaceae archaeon]|nr:amidohydrolase family protein [Methanomicrobiaceae archaeon]